MKTRLSVCVITGLMKACPSVHRLKAGLSLCVCTGECVGINRLNDCSNEFVGINRLNESGYKQAK